MTYVLLARPAILLSVGLVYAVGSLIARAFATPFDWPAFGWGLAALLLVSFSIDYANEYADYETDALTKRTLWSGGSGMIPAGRVTRGRVLAIAWLTLALGLLVALVGFLADVLSPAALLVLFVGTVAGWFYSLPPLSLAWRGWGEVTNALLGGILLPLFGFAAQTGRIDRDVVLSCAPFALLVFINMLATTWPDREADAQVGKLTLATRLSARQLRLLYVAAAALSFAIFPLLSRSILPSEVLIGSFLALPIVLWAARRYTQIESPDPTVAAMSTLLVLQLAAWFVAA